MSVSVSDAMPKFSKVTPPKEGSRISVKDNKLVVPDDPIIPVIRGDGTGRDIMKASKRVLSAAVEKAYGGKKKLVWFDVQAGEDAQEKYGELLPEDTVNALRYYYVSLKGPLTTPVGKGFRSINVAMRQILDLYACVRPCKYIKGVPSPVKHPEKVDMIIFREATEDVYSGIEWQAGTPENKKVMDFLNNEMKCNIREGSGIGIKPISEFCTKRLFRKAVRYALDNGRKSIGIMHKGNIMKYTEGSFRDWVYECAKQEYSDVCVLEDDLKGDVPAGKILVKDRIADSMFQQVLTRPDEYDIIITPNLNGDFIADGISAQVGGLGLAPSGNIGDFHALLEATHGSAPKYADKDVINPSAVVFSGAEMLRYLGWREACDKVYEAVQKTIEQKTVTYDLERMMQGATKVKCSEFGDKVIANL